MPVDPGPRRGVGAPVVDAPAAAPPSAPPRPHLAYLDGLRGVAILMVLAIHAGQLVSGLPGPVRDLSFYGVRGVQLFFIVSGYTLAINYAGRPFKPANFAARRFFRIAPMFYAGAALYGLLAAATAMPLATRDAGPVEVAATLLFLHGWIPGAINAVVPGGWSIAAEAMFYLSFPALLPLMRRPRAMGALLVASYAAAGVVHLLLRRSLPGPEGAEMALYFWVVQFPAFVGGCWLATLVRADALPLRGARLALAAAIVAIGVDSQLRGTSNLLVAIGLLTLFMGAAVAVRPGFLEGARLSLIGRISFSLYILQFAVLGALRPFVPGVEAALGPVAALGVVFAAALAIAGTLARFTYRWIELPAIRATRTVGLARAAA